VSSQRTILITAATGNVGPHAARAALQEGASVRALVLPDDPHLDRLPPDVELFTGNLADPDCLDAALDGVDGVFWMWPFFTLSTGTAQTVLDKIERQAARIALVSSVGVHIGLERQDNNCHAYLEELIARTTLGYTFLRTTGFMANALGFAEQIRTSKTVRFPYGDAVRTPVDEADLAAVGVRALLDEAHAHQRYLVTGPEALSQRRQVDIIGEVIGRSLSWDDVEADEARAQMIATGWPPSYAAGALDYFRRLTLEDEVGSDTVARVLGRPATTFREWVERRSHAFM
jgi:uncharacterized protein YbjT (DUF2867 family)